jgi:hypothetical protein
VCFSAFQHDAAFSQHASAQLDFQVEQKNAGRDRTLGKTFNLRTTAGHHSLFAAAALSILMSVEVSDGLSSRFIVFNRSLWRLILQTQGLHLLEAFFSDVTLQGLPGTYQLDGSLQAASKLQGCAVETVLSDFHPLP